MTLTTAPVLFLLTATLLASPAFAWLRTGFEDAVVVERSELIVVARLKPGTIQYVPHKKSSHGGGSWEYHATLVIKDVLKGKCREKELPIIIHYGLTPRVGGHVNKGGVAIDSRGQKANSPKGIIEIIDTGASGLRMLPLVKDARQDNLWFLRKRSGTFGRKPGKGKYGIVDPKDLQPLKGKDYILAYMADDPEKAIKQYVEKNPDIAARAKWYLDHLDIQRILKIKDPAKRYDKLLPFFLSRTKGEARDGILSCGKIAGPRLKTIFDDPRHAALRGSILLMWRDLKYREAVPFLIDLLKKHDRYWATQKLKKGWWSDNANPQTQHRKTIYGETYYIVCALRALGDPRARSVIEATRGRWKSVNFDNTQIVEECESALRTLPIK